jgi:hypothetical protein
MKNLALHLLGQLNVENECALSATNQLAAVLIFQNCVSAYVDTRLEIIVTIPEN